MRRLNVLSPFEATAFDKPFKMSKAQQHRYFACDRDFDKLLKRRHSKDNKVGLLIQYAYFKAHNRFFSPYYFYKQDINFAAKQLGYSPKEINLLRYPESTRLKHQETILKQLDHRPFEKGEASMQTEIATLVEKHYHPSRIVRIIIETLRREKIEIPSYDKIAKSVTAAILNYEASLVNMINVNTTALMREAIAALREKPEGTYERTLLTRLKSIPQSIRPKKIRRSMRGYLQLKQLREQLLPLIDALNLSAEAVQYYGVWVLKARSKQLEDVVDSDKATLYLVAFVEHQYCVWQDCLLKAGLLATKGQLNKIEQAMREMIIENNARKNTLASNVIDLYQTRNATVDAVKSIVFDNERNDTTKVIDIKSLLANDEGSSNDPTIASLEDMLNHEKDETHYLDLLRKFSTALQLRVSSMLQHLDFDPQTKKSPLFSALLHYQKREGDISKTAPHAFLTEAEQSLVNKEDKFDISLYKALLITKVMQAVRGGTLSLVNSYRYRAMDTYLFSRSYWERNKAKLIKLAGLTDFADVNVVMKKLKKLLIAQYETTNQQINNDNNPHIHFKQNGDFVLHTPAVEKFETQKIASLLDQGQPISILSVLAEVNQAVNFTHGFKHYRIKDQTVLPSASDFIATLFATGTNIGTYKLGNTATGVNQNTLEHTAMWYFSLENLHAVNKILVNCMDKLSLPNLFKRDNDLLHTSGDAKKRNVSAESLDANGSYKYHGNGKGVNVYLFIDERQIIFYTSAFSSAERDAGYVIDGLLHNEDLVSDRHSTDTHGYTEAVFALSHFIGIDFAPRIKGIASQTLSILGTGMRRQFRGEGYKILPSHVINVDTIKKHWDDILRLMATIILRETKTSVILKRFNSYEEKNVFYDALQEFGKIIKSLFILKYIDDVKLRQAIQKQLNRGELANKFSDAIFFAENRELSQVTGEEQEIAMMCKVIIQNCIVLWNYLTLTKQMMDATEEERNDIITIVTNGSIFTWAHINMLGIYDFSGLVAKNDSQYNIEELLGFRAA
jgi:TnpA family transposase